MGALFEGWDGHTCSLIASVNETAAVDKQECGVAPTEDGSGRWWQRRMTAAATQG